MPNDYELGGRFPDFVLPDHTKTPRRLSVLQSSAPMLVVLIRGLGCPKDREQLQALTRFQAQPGAHRCALAVITSDDWLTALTQRHALGATYPFLCDSQGLVCDTLGIGAPEGSGAQRPLVPHTFLLAPALRIHRVWSGPYYWDRPSPCELHEALRDGGAQNGQRIAAL